MADLTERQRPGTSWHGAAERPARGDGTDLKSLIARLNRDATQLMHDELELARLEFRDVGEAFARDVRTAGRTLARDLAKVGVALSLATMAGLALTAGAVLGIGRLLGDAFWAGGLIVGAVLLAAAAAFGMSSARDLRDSEALRMQHGRETLEEDAAVLREEARETKRLARDEAAKFKRAATPPEKPRH